ncbi:small integral membrane protein 44 isoform 1-T1 [Acridotheres tristis]
MLCHAELEEGLGLISGTITTTFSLQIQAELLLVSPPLLASHCFLDLPLFPARISTACVQCGLGLGPDWAFGPKPEDKAGMAEGTVLEAEWLEKDEVLVEQKADDEGTGILPDTDIPLGLLAPRSSVSFADSPKKRFF